MKWFGLLLLCSALSFAQAPFSSRRAPGFSLPDLKLKQHDLQNYRGKVVLLDFMRTNCPKCQEVSRALEETKAEFGAKVVVLSVVNPPDNQQTVAKYIADNGVTGPVLFDCGQMTASFFKITPSNPNLHLPQVLVIDGAGQIRRELSESKPAELTGKGMIQIVSEVMQP